MFHIHSRKQFPVVDAHIKNIHQYPFRNGSEKTGDRSKEPIKKLCGACKKIKQAIAMGAEYGFWQNLSEQDYKDGRQEGFKKKTHGVYVRTWNLNFINSPTPERMKCFPNHQTKNHQKNIKADQCCCD